MSEISKTLQTPKPTRPNQEALAALLIITVLAIGSLFVVAKTAGNRLMRSTIKRDQGAAKFMPAPKMKQGQRSRNLIEMEPSAVPWTIDEGLPNRTSNHSSKHSQPSHASQQTKHNRNFDTELSAIHDWEETTRDRIQRRKNRLLEKFSSSFNDDPHSATRKREMYSIKVWEESTLDCMQQEKTRRLRRISSSEWQNVGSAGIGKGVDKTFGACLEAAKREAVGEKGGRAVNEWEIE